MAAPLPQESAPPQERVATEEMIQDTEVQEVQESPVDEEEMEVVPPMALTAPPMGYRTLDQIEAEFARIAGADASIEWSIYGESPAGRPLHALRMGPAKNPEGLPEAMIVANLAGDRIAATEIALGIAMGLAKERGDWAQAGILWVIPCANPDGFHQAFAGQPVSRGAGIDDDRDGRVDEDGPRISTGMGSSLGCGKSARMACTLPPSRIPGPWKKYPLGKPARSLMVCTAKGRMWMGIKNG